MTGVAIINGAQLMLFGASYVTAAVLSETVRVAAERHVAAGRPLSGSLA